MRFRFLDPVQDFADGLEVLRRYHAVFFELGTELLHLSEGVCRDGMDEARANRCVEMHCFYLRANVLHHRDEEYALFPLLVNRSRLIDGMIERLALDHEEIEEAWNTLGEYLGRPEHVTDTLKLVAHAREFEKLQREHLIREDEDFLPQVNNLLDVEQRIGMAGKMAELRKSS